MPLPLIPIIKLLALGSLKIIALAIGALFMPVMTLRLVLGGTGESIRLTADWLRTQNRLTKQEADTLTQLLSRVQRDPYTPAEARQLLFKMIKKSAAGFTGAVTRCAATVMGWFGLKR